MREPALGLKTSLLNGSSFLKRIHENLLSVWRLPWVPLPVVHAPILLLDEQCAHTAPAAQFGSTLVHMLLCAGLLWSVAQPSLKTTRDSAGPQPHLPPVPKWLVTSNAGALGLRGDSGGHSPLPPTTGSLAPMSRAAFIPPHLADSRPRALAVQVMIANPDAPELARSVNDLGLPWLNDKNNSEGRGENGIGDGKNHGMGDGPGNGSGVGYDGRAYAPVASQVICRVCPNPSYSEEARKTKLQGTVILSVLVGADGRVKDVRVIRGLGLGLDENAIQTVRNWQFLPAKDAAQQSVASWIKVETVFRLF
jgi:protein TonB